MTLPAGTPLQDGKYIIQLLLNQSDFGLTYQATHALLGQSVILQTFNTVAQQRSDYELLKQKFMTGVRSLSQKSDDRLRMLDCFEEAGRPFVVLQAIPGQLPPHLNDWLLLAPEAKLPAAPEAKPLPLAPQPEASDATIAATAPPQALEVQEVSEAAMPVQLQPREVVLPTGLSGATNGTKPHLPTVPKPQLSAAVLIAVLAGLGLGAGGGVAIRYSPNSSQSVPHLFGNRQSFPSEGDWPITEIPTSTTAPRVEQPLYLSTPVPESYSPPLEQLPPAPAPSAIQPLPEPEARTSPDDFTPPKPVEKLPPLIPPRSEPAPAEIVTPAPFSEPLPIAPDPVPVEPPLEAPRLPKGAADPQQF